jgi:asparagine synthetase B (glutamine-hydrolysing)
LALGSARLSIIDLSSGQQPMTNEDRSLWIVFNGEIFNYVELRAELLAQGHRAGNAVGHGGHRPPVRADGAGLP